GHADVLVQGHLHGAYLVQMLTDWIGPFGVLKKFGWSNRRPGFAGDTLTCRGRVTRVYAQNGEHLADCEIWEENQRGDVCAPGTATVALPSRGEWLVSARGRAVGSESRDYGPTTTDPRMC